jgi:hypothetical protein
MKANARTADEKKADDMRLIESRKTSAARKHGSQEKEAKISAFAVFSKERHEAVSDRATVIAHEWKAMSRLDKIPFITAAKLETRSLRSGGAEDYSAYGENSAESCPAKIDKN